MMQVKGYRILVKPDEIDTVSKGGIIMVLDERMELASQQFGTVICIGPTCWTDGQGNALERWCEVGDRVVFSKHAGRFVYDPTEDDAEYMVINDNDIIAVIGEG